MTLYLIAISSIQGKAIFISPFIRPNHFRFLHSIFVSTKKIFFLIKSYHKRFLMSFCFAVALVFFFCIKIIKCWQCNTIPNTAENCKQNVKKYQKWMKSKMKIKMQWLLIFLLTTLDNENRFLSFLWANCQ